VIRLKYSLVIEATDDPAFFGFYSPDLEGFSGAGRSINDCLDKARAGMDEHVQMLGGLGLPVPAENPDARVTIHDERRPARSA